MSCGRASLDQAKIDASFEEMGCLGSKGGACRIAAMFPPSALKPGGQLRCIRLASDGPTAEAARVCMGVLATSCIRRYF